MESAYSSSFWHSFLKVTGDENGLKEIKNDIDSHQKTPASISINNRNPDSANLAAYDRKP
ncbi:MAG: hypothetical protein WA461_05870 [Nitrososphaeraceae archaeon]